MSQLTYLQGYPENLLSQVRTLIAEQRLGRFCRSAIRKVTTSITIRRCISTRRI